MDLKQEFNRRFADFKTMEGQFDLLCSPFSCNIETTAKEILKLQLRNYRWN